jgi:chromosome segregation ATPase
MEKQILQALQQMNEKLDEQSKKLDEHGETLKEHGRILGALRSGQEVLKAELKLQNAKDFGELWEQIKDIEVSVEILREESWNNRKDIRRVQITMGLA